MIHQHKKDKEMPDTNEDAKTQSRLNELIDGEGWSKLSFWQKLKTIMRPKNNDRAHLKNILIQENLFNLLMGSLWPPLIRAKDMHWFAGGVALDTTKRNSQQSWERLKYDINDHIWVDGQRKLTTEISAMPLVEKEPIEEEIHDIPERLARQPFRMIETRIAKIISMTGIIGSAVALAPLMAPLVGGMSAAIAAVGGMAMAGTAAGLHFSTRLNKLSKRSQEHIRAAWREMIKYRRISNRGAETLEATGKQEEINEKYRLADQDSKEVDMAINQKRMKIGTRNIWTSVGISLGSLGIVTALGFLNGLTLPAIAASASGIYLASNTFLGSLQRLFGAIQTENDLNVQMRHDYSKIRHKKEYDLTYGNKKLKGNENVLRIKGIRFSLRDKNHPENRVDKPMIESQETIVFGPGINVINGPSGCGKTTLYKLLKHWDDLDSGSIEYGTIDENGNFHGTPLTELGPNPKLPIAFSFQQTMGFRDMTIDEFWRLGAEHMDPETIKKWADKYEIDIWTKSTPPQYKQMRNLSGGELKRAAFILSLLQHKPILVIDECTSGLNEVLAKKVVDEINELGKERTIIFTTHNVDELARLDVKQLIDIHKRPDGTSELTVYKDISKKQKQDYIAAIHASEPKKEEKEPTTAELIRESLAGTYHVEAHKNVFLRKLEQTLAYGQMVDARKSIRAIKANKELSWSTAIRKGKLREKLKRNVEASFISPQIHHIADRKTARKKRSGRT